MKLFAGNGETMNQLTEEDYPLMEGLLELRDGYMYTRDMARIEVDRLIGMQDMVRSKEDYKKLEAELTRVRKIEKQYTKKMMTLTVKKIADKFDVGISQVRYRARKELRVYA